MEGDSKWTLINGLKLPRRSLRIVVIDNEAFSIGRYLIILKYLMTLSCKGGNPTGKEVLKLNKTMKTWEKVDTMNYYRHYHAVSVVDSLEVLNICNN